MRDSDIKHMPVVIFFACLDLEQKPLFPQFQRLPVHARRQVGLRFYSVLKNLVLWARILYSLFSAMMCPSFSHLVHKYLRFSGLGSISMGTLSVTSRPYPSSPMIFLGLLVISRILRTPRSTRIWPDIFSVFLSA